MINREDRYLHFAIVMWVYAVCLLAVGLSCDARADGPPPLADRMRAWLETGPVDGRWRLRERGATRDIDRVASAILGASSQAEWPSPELLAALTYRESRWRPEARGRLGEIGLAQIHPRWIGHSHGHLPEVNLRIAVEILRNARTFCGTESRTLRRYATGECGEPTWAERSVLRWEQQIREAR